MIKKMAGLILASFLPVLPVLLVGWKHAVRDFKSDYLFRNENPTPSTKMLRVRGFFEFPATLGYAPEEVYFT